MSEVVNEAVIKVTADATGVESGLRKVGAAVSEVSTNLQAVDAAATKTGKTIESLGQRSGLKNLGEGADVAAMRVDKSTRNMADAIQRATAAMDSGAKGSSAYFASLANSRGLNMTVLAPYLAQLDAVTQKTAAAAAAQRQLETSSRFLDGLRSQAEGIGKTASQLAALRAEQLGVADAARPLIEQLQAAEEAAGGAEESTGGFSAAVAAIGLGGGIASIAQLADEYGKYVSQLELATEGQTEFANAQTAVKRIATTAQSDLSATGSLYANITKSTRELGLAQSQVADITETVSLGLKVSNASSEAAASAILQLSQAFASGVLRGDEFNSVNEAAPRLMQALADGIGVPTGALRKMAEEGELTTAVLAQALPNALGTLRTEAESVQTIGGAMTVLKNEILEMVGATAQSSGVVAVLSGGIKLLSDNLVLAAGAAATLAAAKLGSALSASAVRTWEDVAANRALAAANYATAQSNVAATGSASALAAARVVELRAAVAAAEGNVALAITTNGLIPAQARAAAAAAAHTAALTAQAAAASATSVSAGVLRGALALLGGPVGAVIALLGIGATAWAVWGDSAKKAEEDSTKSVKASTEEILETLGKQIEKLKERNRLASMGFKPKEVESPAGERLGEVTAQIDRAGRGVGEYANLNLEARTEILKALGREYGRLTEGIAEFNKQSDIDAGNKAAKSAAEWMEKYATNTEKASAEIAKAKKELGAAFTPELEARIRKQFEGRDSSSKKYEEQMKREAAMAAELAGLSSTFADDWKLLSTMYAKGALSLEQLTKAQEKLLKNQPGMKEAAEQEAEDRKKSIEAAEQYAKAYDVASQGAAAAAKSLLAQRDENEQIGLGARALAELNAQRLEDLALRAEGNIWAAEGIDITGQMAERYREEAAALRERAQAIRDGAGKREAEDSNKKALQELNQFLDPSRAQTFGEALREAFGTAGESLSRLTANLDGYGKRQAEIEKHRETAEKNRGKGDFDEVKYLKTVGELNEREVKNRLQGYGDMASAAKGFFSDGSKGYKLMEGAEKAFRAMELASQMESLYTHLFVTTSKATATAAGQTVETGAVTAGEAARNTAKIPGVFMSFMSSMGPWGMAAAGVAIAAVLGGAFSGGGGVPLSQDRQEKQGTGSVFGDPSAKSESIAKSLDLIEGATFQGLGISSEMLVALRSIESNIGSFASLVVETTSLGRPIANGGRGAAAEFGSSTAGVLLTGGVIGVALDKLTGGWVGKITGSIMNRLFGGKTTVEDTGFAMDKIAYADLFKGQLSAYQYADIKKAGGLFSSDKYSTKTEGLGQDGNRQFALILESLYESVFQAGKLLELNADDFSANLNSFVVDIGKISFKDMDSDEIQKELEAVFSKVGDDLARFGAGGLESFQKVGEGYLETLTRVAADYQMVTVVTESLGMSFNAVGFGSIAARERLIDLAGGLEEFASSAEQFLTDFYTDKEQAAALRARLQPTLDRYGIQSGADDSLAQFRDVVKNLKLETADGAQAFGELMQIMPAFKQLADFDKAKFEERLELQDKYDQLTMTAAQLLGKQRDALDESNRALFDQVRVLEERAGLQEELDNLTLTSEQRLLRQRDALDASNRSLFDQVQMAAKAKAAMEERKGLQEQLDQLTMTSAQLLEKQRSALDESNRALFDQVQAAREQKDATEKAATAIKAATDSAAATIRSFGDAVMDSINRAKEGAQALRDFNDALLLGSLSTLDPEEKYREAKRQFEAADPSNTQAAQAFLQASKDRGGDSFYYERDFAKVREKIAAGAKALDERAAMLPSFYWGYAQAVNPALAVANPPPAVTQVSTPPVVQQTATMSKTSAQQADLSRLEAKVDGLLTAIGDNMQEIASSTADTAKYIGKVTDKGAAMRTA